MTAPTTSPNRAQGRLVARFARHGDRTRAVDLHEAGGYRMRFPKVLSGRVPDCEAVCINTGGGVVGGDAIAFDFACGPDAAVVLTTQSAEKMYGTRDAAALLDVRLAVASGGRLDWLPQDTIIFEGARFARTLTVDLAPDASFTIAEMLVFGRQAMGETVTRGSLRDRWRVRRGGRLVFAEELRIAGAVQAVLDRPALGGGARALVTLLLVAPDAEARLDALRAVLDDARADVDWGASAWNGLLTLRAAATSPDALRRIMVTALEHLRGQPVPRVWQ